MTRQEKIVWGLFAGILIFLFLLSSTDVIIKEKKTEIYRVSVIISDTTDNYYSNFRKGVDQAAADYNVDTSFITLYEKGDVKQQMELVSREIDDGAGAVILVPLKPEECGDILECMTLNAPLIIMGNRFPNEKAVNGISPDHREEGRRLGEAIVKENSPDTPVCLFSAGLAYGYGGEIYDGLMAVLSKAGFHASLYQRNMGNGDTFRKALEEAAGKSGGKAILAALDVESLDAATDFIEGSPELEAGVFDIYGVGSTTRLLNRLDRGSIRGLVVTNQFDSGYLAIEKAVEAIQKTGKKEQLTLNSYYVEKEDLRTLQFEKILYPIE